ncbi:DUF1799 domain-containing protein [Paraneptunicella aestuarii]|uniref:DUF1799 domain-containing protein n=1 Tax=Paraneptunicella aestuarii TaxID=2831148 RepID=UPI001E4A682B|nr:DUF1799 domain-containing protein [Paraneptunicella aestuarii]UAA39408.1 DUF1799 domain-containing protein [Paraneptunicella aestuarii]
MALLKGLSPKFAQEREQNLEIWPETLPAIRLFAKSMTQWRAGPTGIIGLDYNAINLLMDYDAIPMAERGELMSDIAQLEIGYLQAMRR